MNKQPDAHSSRHSCAALDGRDDRLLQWITDSGLVALIADNYAVEAHPADAASTARCADLPLHEHCLFKLGVNLGEIWYLTDARRLAAREQPLPLSAHRAAAAAARARWARRRRRWRPCELGQAIAVTQRGRYALVFGLSTPNLRQRIASSAMVVDALTPAPAV